YSLAMPNVVQSLTQLVTAPVESFDALVCSSQAVLRMVRSVTGLFSDYLRERQGGDPSLRMRLEVIPPGVPTDTYRPVSPEQKQAQRKPLKINPDEIAVLYAGQIAFHARAHPMPLFVGLAEAARATNQKVHLLLAGWSYQEALLKAFTEGARIFAPNVRV